MKISNFDYRTVLEDAEEGDLVFLDPPYDNHSDYYRAANSFNQRELMLEMDRLTVKNVKCVLINSETVFVRELYDGYNIYEYTRARKSDGKLKTELIICNFGTDGTNMRTEVLEEVL